MPATTLRLMPVPLIEQWRPTKIIHPPQPLEEGEQLPSAPSPHQVIIQKEPDEQPKNTWQQMVAEVIDMLPPTYQKRAARLMKRLEGYLELDDWQLRVQWANGEPGSHLMDLLQYLLMTGAARSKSKMEKPRDFESFLQLMANVGIPDSLVGSGVAQQLARARRLLRREQVSKKQKN